MPSWKVWVAAAILLPVVALLIGLLIPPTPPPVFRLPGTWDPGCPEIRTIWQQAEQSSTYVTAPRGPLLYTGTTTPSGLLYNKLQLKRIGMDGQEVRSVLLNDVSLPAVLDAGETLWMVYRGGGGFDFIVAQLDPVSLKVRTHWVIPIPKGTAATSGGNHTFPMSLATTQDGQLLISYGARQRLAPWPMDACELWLLPLDSGTGAVQTPIAFPGTLFGYGSRLSVTENGECYWLGRDYGAHQSGTYRIDLEQAQATQIPATNQKFPAGWRYPATLPVGYRATGWPVRRGYEPWQTDDIHGREFFQDRYFAKPTTLAGRDLLSSYLSAKGAVYRSINETLNGDEYGPWESTLESTWLVPFSSSGSARQMSDEFTDSTRHARRGGYWRDVHAFAFPDGRQMIAQRVIDDPRPGRDGKAMIRLGMLGVGATTIDWFTWLELPEALSGPPQDNAGVSLDVYDDLWCLTFSTSYSELPGEAEMAWHLDWCVFPAPEGIELPVGTGHNWRVQKSAKS